MVIIRARRNGPAYLARGRWKRHNNLFYRRLLMNKYIGLDIDCKKTVGCVIEAGRGDRYVTINSDIGSMSRFLRSEKRNGYRVEEVFEISGQAGFIYDS